MPWFGFVDSKIILFRKRALWERRNKHANFGSVPLGPVITVRQSTNHTCHLFLFFQLEKPNVDNN